MWMRFIAFLLYPLMDVDFLLSIVDRDPENSQIYSYVTLHLVSESIVSFLS